MNKVYVVGVMQVDLSNETFSAKKAERLWHLFARFEDAQKCVLENHTDIFEYYYNIALIEEHYVYDPDDPPPPLHDIMCAKQWWYRAEYTTDYESNSMNPMNPVVKEAEQPKCFHGIVNFWVG